MPEVVASPDSAESGDEVNNAGSQEENDEQNFIDMMIEIDESYDVPPVDESHDVAHAALKKFVDMKGSRFGRSICFPIAMPYICSNER